MTQNFKKTSLTMFFNLAITLPSALTLIACAPPAPPETTDAATPPPAASDELPDAQSVPRDDQEPAAAQVESKDDAPTAQTLKDVGFSTPECVYYDATQDLSFISNINGAPLEKDDNGFISRLKPDGSLELKFIDGQSEKFQLNAPKGMTVYQGVLYVVDIDTVHSFDAKTGEFMASLLIEGSDFLNDIAADKEGTLFVTDTAVDATFSSTKNDAIYQIKGEQVSTFARNESLGGANGIAVTEGGLLVNSFASGELYRVNADGQLSDVQKIEGGQLDGLVQTNAGDYLMSSWGASALLRGKPGESFSVIADNLKAPADIGYDSKRNQVLIPLFMSNEVKILPLD